MDTVLHIYLQVISPVHIGCDEVYEPTSFVIDESRKKLIAFDPLNFIKGLSEDERKKFTELCAEGTIASIPRLYVFMSRKKISGREIDIAHGLTANYQSVKSLANANDEQQIGQELNRFAINRTAFNPHTETPYIPGSSIKGSLRTAYLNKLAKEKKSTRWQGKAKELEVKLLEGSFETDPLRMVKVSDMLPIGNVQTKIVYAVNKKKRPSQFAARGPHQILEIIQPGAVFKGTLTINKPLPNAGIKQPITDRELFDSLKEFYMEDFNIEQKLMEGIGADCKVYVKAKEDFRKILGDKAFFIRLGRHSGAEAVTIAGNRQIKIMQGRGQQPRTESSATTVWLASENAKTANNNGLLPFGWAVLSLEPLAAPLADSPDTASATRTVEAIPKPQRPPEMKPLDKFIAEIKPIKPQDAGRINSIIDKALKKLETDEEKRSFARAVQEHMGNAFKKSKAKDKLERFLDS